MNAIKIKNSIWKTILLLLAAIAFVVIGIFILLDQESDLIMKGIAIIGILFFGAAIPIGIIKIVKSDAELELTDKHLIIQPNTKKEIKLNWSEIVDFNVVKIKGTKIITILVSNPQSWIDKETNLIKRKLMKFNLNNYGTPFSITTSSLAVSHHKLLDQLRARIIN